MDGSGGLPVTPAGNRELSHAAQHSGVPSLHAPSSTCPTCRIPLAVQKGTVVEMARDSQPNIDGICQISNVVRPPDVGKRNYAKGTLGNQHAAHNFGHLQLYIHWLDSRPLIHIVGALAPIPPSIPPRYLAMAKALISGS